MTNLDSILKSRDITLPTNVCLVKAMVFPVVMWELDCEEGWGPKNWWFWTVVLGKTLESPLDCKEIQPAHYKGDQPWDFFGRNNAKAETPVLRSPHAKSWLIGKDSDAGRDWGLEEQGMTEDEMAGWHNWLDGHESAWTPGVGDGQGGLECCNSWGCKESDTTKGLNWTFMNTKVTTLLPMDYLCSLLKHCRNIIHILISVLHSVLFMKDSFMLICNTRTHYFHWRISELRSVQSFSHVRLFATSWTAAHQASLSITNCLSPPKPMSIESVMPSNHLILCRPFSYCPQTFPASGSFQMSQLFVSGGQGIGVSVSTSVLPMKTEAWSPLEWTAWISLQSKGLSRVFSNTTVQKHQFFSTQASSQSNTHIHTWPQEKP